jgi:hypothetical protein
MNPSQHRLSAENGYLFNMAWSVLYQYLSYLVFDLYVVSTRERTTG